MTVRVLNVWWNGRIVGQFTQDQHGDIGFAYAEAWLEDEKALPLSVSLPKRPERFFAVNAAHFLAAYCQRKASVWLRRRRWVFHLPTTSPFLIAWAATSPARFNFCPKTRNRLEGA